MRGFGSGGFGPSSLRASLATSTGPNRRYLYKDSLDGKSGDKLPWRPPNYGVVPDFNNVNFDNSVRFFNGGGGNNQGYDSYVLDGLGGAQIDLSFVNYQAQSRYKNPSINIELPTSKQDYALEFEVELNLIAPYGFSLLLAGRVGFPAGGTWVGQRNFVGAVFDVEIGGQLTVKAVHCNVAAGYVASTVYYNASDYLVSPQRMRCRLEIAGQSRRILVNDTVVYSDSFTGFATGDDGIYFSPVFEGIGTGLTTTRVMSIAVEEMLVDFAAETGTFGEAQAPGFTTTIGETGTFSDQQSLARLVYVAEQGTFSESVAANSGFVNNIGEHGAFSDALRSVIPTTLNQSGTFSEATSFVVASGSGDINERGAFSESTSIAVTFANNAAVTGTFTDATRVGPVTTTAETGTLTSTTECTSTFANNAAESGAFTEAFALQRTGTDLATESGRFSEAVSQMLTGYNLAVETGFFSDATQGQGAAGAWVAHLETFAMSRYTDYNFDSIATVDGVLIGAAADGGVYRLDGANDAGDDINATVEFDWTDQLPGKNGMVSEPRFKSPRSFYAAGTCDGGMALELGYALNGAPTSTTYSFPLRTQSAFVTNRVALGRGIRSRFLKHTLRNVAGADFEMTPLPHTDIDLSERTI